VGTPHFNICYKIPAYPELRNRIYAACDASFADDPPICPSLVAAARC
jgi:hypothetical protein